MHVQRISTKAWCTSRTIYSEWYEKHRPRFPVTCTRKAIWEVDREKFCSFHAGLRALEYLETMETSNG